MNSVGKEGVKRALLRIAEGSSEGFAEIAHTIGPVVAGHQVGTTGGLRSDLKTSWW